MISEYSFLAKEMFAQELVGLHDAEFDEYNGIRVVVEALEHLFLLDFAFELLAFIGVYVELKLGHAFEGESCEVAPVLERAVKVEDGGERVGFAKVVEHHLLCYAHHVEELLIDDPLGQRAAVGFDVLDGALVRVLVDEGFELLEVRIGQEEVLLEIFKNLETILDTESRLLTVAVVEIANNLTNLFLGKLLGVVLLESEEEEVLVLVGSADLIVVGTGVFAQAPKTAFWRTLEG